MVQSAALLAGAVGVIRDVVRCSGAMCIGFVEVELGRVNPNPNPSVNANANASVAGSTSTSHVHARNAAPAVGGIGIETAFASQTGRTLRVNLNPTLARVVEEAVDVLVAVHDADGKIDARADRDRDTKRIAEVVRDERADHAGEGSAVGAWAVWE